MGMRNMDIRHEQPAVFNCCKLTNQIEIPILQGTFGIPQIIEKKYSAGNGIIIKNKTVSLDNLIINCGRGITLWEE